MSMPKLIFDNWRLVEYDGLPNDGDWCIVTWEDHNGNVDWFVGGYQAEHKQFYANFGFGGAVLKEESVVGWTLLDEYRWDMEQGSDRHE